MRNIQKKYTILSLLKIEDVSMIMWVEKFNTTNFVQYSHNMKFCQFRYMENC
uniref:Uncharacterized protein n=1 Tax=Nelumbo nucifera TaxID=4432 RepID=A0A822YDJ9_NELNU|nr:TPA_asm: hypothetical protein HUJ06_030594 [Nelumbo nucifera]